MTRFAPARLLLALVAVLAALLLPAAPAWAHNSLAEATPAKDATLKKAPAEVRLRFLQKLNPDATTIAVTGPGEAARVAVSEPKVDGATATVRFTEPPANGEYRVAYQVTSTDGHSVKGSYTFTVAAPVPVTTAPTTAPPTTAPATTTPTTVPISVTPVPLAGESDGGMSGGAIAGIVVAALAVVGLAGLLIARRRRQGRIAST